MGASSKDFTDIREQEYMINATFKVKGVLINPIENYLNETANLISYKTIQDTDELYQTDPTFKKLVKAESHARKNKEIYINNKL